MTHFLEIVGMKGVGVKGPLGLSWCVFIVTCQIIQFLATLLAAEFPLLSYDGGRTDKLFLSGRRRVRRPTSCFVVVCTTYNTLEQMLFELVRTFQDSFEASYKQVHPTGESGGQDHTSWLSQRLAAC